MANSVEQLPTRLLSVKQASHYLGVSIPTLKRRAREGDIPSLKLGRLRKFDRKALDHWIERGGQSHAA